MDFKNLDLISYVGTEADIFSDFQTVYKIYKSKHIDLKLKDIKLEILSVISMEGLVCPKQKIVSPTLAGYSMDYIDGSYITKLSLTKLELIKLFKTISRLLKYYHSCGIILADVNMSNILIKSPEEVYFCDIDSCKILDFPHDSIPVLAHRFLTRLGIDVKNVIINENFDNLCVFLIFLYVIFDRRDILSLAEYDLDKTLEEKGFESQKVFVKQFRNRLIEVPYIGDML